MSLVSALLAGQRAWLKMATDTCRITREAKVGDSGYVAQTINESTGQYPAQGRVTIYEGPCRIQVKVDINSNVVETTAGDREETYLISQLQLPVVTPAGATGDVNDVDVDHICEVLTSLDSPPLVGSKFNVAGPFHKSHATYLRFRIREAAG